MAAVRFLFLGICFSFVYGGDLPKRDMLTLVRIAQGEVGVRELIGYNDGPRVEEYLAYVGLRRGAPWCAAFVSWVHLQAGYTKPKNWTETEIRR